MLNALKSSLGSKNPLAVAQLARHICAEDTNSKLSDTVISLLKSDYNVAELLSALLQCESTRMKTLFSGHSAMPLNIQFDELRRAIHGFNDIQDTVMEAGESYLSEMHARNMRGAAQLPGKTEDRICEYSGLHEQERARIKGEVIINAMKEWTDTRSVRLFNQFRGIPINATAKLLGKGKEKICIALDHEVAKVFASHPDKNCAFLACPNEEEQVAVSILNVDKGNITLKLEEVSPLYVEKRRELGVQIAENVAVSLSSKGRHRGTAQLFDISISGFGLILKHVSDPDVFKNGDEIQCEFTLNDKKIRTSAWVRWLQKHDDLLRIGVELKSDKALQQLLQQEIFRIQRSIIVAMNEVELPEDIREAL